MKHIQHKLVSLILTLMLLWQGVAWPDVLRPQAAGEKVSPKGTSPATLNLYSLQGYGVPKDILDELFIRHGKNATLLELQRIAIQEGLFDRERALYRNGVVYGPTSSGKTLIPELRMIIRKFSPGQRPNKTIYLVPKRALGQEKARYFERVYGKHGVQVLYSDGSETSNDDKILKGEFDVAVIVYEKLKLFQQHNPQFLSCVGEVVIDELGVLSDKHRGPYLETVIAALRHAHSGLTVLGLMRPTKGMEQLANCIGEKPFLVGIKQRPIDIKIGILSPKRGGGSIFEYWSSNQLISNQEKIEPKSEEKPGLDVAWPKETLQELIRWRAQNGSMMIACPTREMAEGYAGIVNELIKADHEIERIMQRNTKARLIEGELAGLEDTVNKKLLTEFLPKGIGFHDADLTPDERRVVEDAFRDERIPIIFCTSTLAEGVNLPAQTVVFMGWAEGSEKRPFYTRLAKDFVNWLGRAGRFGRKGEDPMAIYVSRSGPVGKEYQTIFGLIHEEEAEIEPHLSDKDVDLRGPILEAINVLSNTRGHLPTLDEVQGFFDVTLTSTSQERKASLHRRVAQEVIGMANPGIGRDYLGLCRVLDNCLGVKDKGATVSVASADALDFLRTMGALARTIKHIEALSDVEKAIRELGSHLRKQVIIAARQLRCSRNIANEEINAIVLGKKGQFEVLGGIAPLRLNRKLLSNLQHTLDSQKLHNFLLQPEFAGLSPEEASVCLEVAKKVFAEEVSPRMIQLADPRVYQPYFELLALVDKGQMSKEEAAKFLLNMGRLWRLVKDVESEEKGPMHDLREALKIVGGAIRGAVGQDSEVNAVFSGRKTTFDLPELQVIEIKPLGLDQFKAALTKREVRRFILQPKEAKEALPKVTPAYLEVVQWIGTNVLSMTEFGRISSSYGLSLNTCDELYTWVRRQSEEAWSRPWDIMDIFYVVLTTSDGKETRPWARRLGFDNARADVNTYLKRRAADAGELRLIGKEVWPDSRLSIMLLAMTGWVLGGRTIELENRYNLRAGFLYETSRQMSRLLRAFGAIAKEARKEVRQPKEVEPTEASPVRGPNSNASIASNGASLGQVRLPDDLEVLSQAVLYGVPKEAVPLAKLGVQGLSRGFIIQLAEKLADRDLPIIERIQGITPDKLKEMLGWPRKLAKRTAEAIGTKTSRPMAKVFRENPLLAQAFNLLPQVMAAQIEQGKNRYTVVRVDARERGVVMRRKNRKGEPIVIQSEEQLVSQLKTRGLEFISEVGWFTPLEKTTDKDSSLTGFTDEAKQTYLVDRYIVDLDPHNNFSLKTLKALTERISMILRAQPFVERVQINWTGGKGFHIVAYLNQPKNVKGVKEEVADLLEEGGIYRHLDVFAELDPLNLEPYVYVDLSQNMRRGCYRNELSLHLQAGGVCVRVDEEHLWDFDPTVEATPQNVMRKFIAQLSDAERTAYINRVAQHLGISQKQAEAQIKEVMRKGDASLLEASMSWRALSESI